MGEITTVLLTFLLIAVLTIIVVAVMAVLVPPLVAVGAVAIKTRPTDSLIKKTASAYGRWSDYWIEWEMKREREYE